MSPILIALCVRETFVNLADKGRSIPVRGCPYITDTLVLMRRRYIQNMCDSVFSMRRLAFPHIQRIIKLKMSITVKNSHRALSEPL